MTPSSISKPRVGPYAVLDEGILLNATSGRKAASKKPLTVGSHARIRFGTVLYSGTQIGNHFETGHHVVIREDSRLGHHVSIWNSTTIDYGCTIGHRVKIHCNNYIAQYSVLGDDVFLAPGVTFANDLFPGGKHAADVMQGPILGRGVHVGVNCTILPGVKIGDGALIGAGSVVTRDVPAGSVVWGNPARVHKQKTDLLWPEGYRITRTAADQFYRRRLSGRLVQFD